MPLPSERPQISETTPGPALAILAICSAGASAFVAGSAVLYQWRVTGASFFNQAWDIALILAVVGWLPLASGPLADTEQVMCIAQSAVTAVHVESGLGYQVDMLTADNVTKFLKVEHPFLRP